MLQHKQGALYIFEGLDNVGKTTIVSALCKNLKKTGLTVSMYSFPGNEAETLGNLVYQIHHNKEKYLKKIDPISMQLLHVAAHIDIINNRIIPDLKSGKIVLLDRSWWSTYAYGLANGINRKILMQIIAPEISILKKISIEKIFLIDRNVTINNYNNCVLKSYQELSAKFSKTGLAEIVNNNGKIIDAVDIIYKKILSRYQSPDFQLDLFNDKSTHSEPKHICSSNVIKSGLVPSSIYNTYWEFAVKRQDIFFGRLNNEHFPWTKDSILKKYKFTNVYRASDRVSQFLIKHVIYNDRAYSAEDMFFRIILFKLFNKIETWRYLEENIGEINYKNYSFEQYNQLLNKLIENKTKIYSAAYIMPPGKTAFGFERKHVNNLKLLELMMRDHITQKIARIKTLKELYQLLLNYPTLGHFLAFQYCVDLNYSELCDFNEMSFVVAGPGAIRGIAKCFNTIGSYSEEDVIRIMAEKQHEEFDRLKLKFKNLWGRPLQLIDCQNLFCEVDKYTRVAFPNIGEVDGKRIKQLFTPNMTDKINYFFPPKWGLNIEIESR